MKKTVVVDLEYMRPSVGGGGRRSRSQSRSRSRSVKRGTTHNSSDHEELNIDALLHHYGDDDDDNNDTTNDNDVSDDWTDDDGDDIIESSGSGSGSGSGSDELPVTEEQRRHPSVKDTDYAVNSDDDLLQSVLDEPTFPLDINAILSAMNKAENSLLIEFDTGENGGIRTQIAYVPCD